MSRIGKRTIIIPNGVTVTTHEDQVTAKGPKGSLMHVLPRGLATVIEEGKMRVEKKTSDRTAGALWGTTARLISNMMEGVSAGFTKQLQLEGVGFRMQLKGKQIQFALGFSHPVLIDIPEGIAVTIENMILTVTGIDKQSVGQFAAEIRALKPVEPYKGKGFHYVGEIVRRKEGKKASAVA